MYIINNKKNYFGIMLPDCHGEAHALHMHFMHAGHVPPSPRPSEMPYSKFAVNMRMIGAYFEVPTNDPVCVG